MLGTFSPLSWQESCIKIIAVVCHFIRAHCDKRNIPQHRFNKEVNSGAEAPGTLRSNTYEPCSKPWRCYDQPWCNHNDNTDWRTASTPAQTATTTKRAFTNLDASERGETRNKRRQQKQRIYFSRENCSQAEGETSQASVQKRPRLLIKIHIHPKQKRSFHLFATIHTGIALFCQFNF